MFTSDRKEDEIVIRLAAFIEGIDSVAYAEMEVPKNTFTGASHKSRMFMIKGLQDSLYRLIDEDLDDRLPKGSDDG